MITSVQFAGHSAVFLHAGDEVAVIDPFLISNPMTPESLKRPEKIDLMILTHGHGDHASEAVEHQQRTGCLVAAGFELASLLVEDGIPADRVVGMNPGGLARIGSWQVALTQAIHSNSYTSKARGTAYAGIASGAVVRHGNDCLFHSGDTCLFSDLALIGEEFHPSLALLCAGGHFTMDGAQAAKAARLLGVKKAVPIHYKTFPLLAQDAEAFLAGCREAGIEGVELAPGESTSLA